MSIQYRLISDGDPDQFNDRVTSQLTDGWELYGTPSVACTSALPGCLDVVFCQALVKYDPPRAEIHGILQTGGEFPFSLPGAVETAKGTPLPASRPWPGLGEVRCTCQFQAGDAPDCPVHSQANLSADLPALKG